MVRASELADGQWMHDTDLNPIIRDYARRAQVPAKYVVFKENSTFYADHCDGTGLDFDETTLNAVLTEVFTNGLTAGRTYKEKIIVKGEHTGLEQIAIPSYTTFEVQGYLKAKNALNDHFFKNSDTVGGNSHIEICGGYIDGNTANQTADFNCIHLETVTYGSVHDSYIKGGGRFTVTNGEAVELTSSSLCDVTNCKLAADADTYDLIKGSVATSNLIRGNILYQYSGNAHGTMAIQMGTGSDENVIVGNTVYAQGGNGIKMHNADLNVVIGNLVAGTPNDCITEVANSSRNLITANTVHYPANPSWGGLTVRTPGAAVDNVLSNNYVYLKDDATSRGIVLDANSSGTRLINNTIIGNGAGVTGIQIDAGATDTWIRGNDLKSAALTTKCTDAGTRTSFDTLNVPFVDGTTFLSADGNSWGWEIDLATEYAIALCQLPPELSQIMRIRIRAVSIVAEADGMTLQIDGYGGTSNEAEGQETIAIVNKVSSTTNFAANDYVYWELTAADDADIGHLTGGDRLQLKLQHEAAAGADCQTDAVFQAVEVEYV